MIFSGDETILHELTPEPRLMVIWFITRCITHGLATAFFTVFTFWFYLVFSGINKGVVVEEYSIIFVAGLSLFFIGAYTSLIYHRYLLKTISYYITDRRCLYKGGLIRHVEHTVSYHKITDVERSQNILERLLGISTINLFTPGTASVRMGAVGLAQPIPELRFEGLKHSDAQAESINEHVRIHGHS